MVSSAPWTQDPVPSGDFFGAGSGVHEVSKFLLALCLGLSSDGQLLGSWWLTVERVVNAAFGCLETAWNSRFSSLCWEPVMSNQVLSGEGLRWNSESKSSCLSCPSSIAALSSLQSTLNEFLPASQPALTGYRPLDYEVWKALKAKRFCASLQYTHLAAKSLI